MPTPEFLARTSPDTRRFFDAFELGTPINGPTLRRDQIVGANGNGPFAALPADLPIFGLAGSGKCRSRATAAR